MLSVLIPSRKEKFLDKTVSDLLQKAQGDLEIICVLDGYWTAPIDDRRVHYIHRGTPLGMRAAINAAAALAKGEFLLKADAHTLWDEGFDVKLAADCEENWVIVPRRKRLDADNWCVQEVGKPDVDYEYLSFPDNPADFGGPGLNGRIWEQRAKERKDIMIDENLSFQGSAWFMRKEYFHKLELMDEEHYGTFWNEAQEIGFKAWLSGGKLMTNKKTWYAHLHKGKKHGRGYNLDHSQLPKGATYTKKWMTNSAWDKQTIPFESLIERFWPLPGWPENWRDLLPTL